MSSNKISSLLDYFEVIVKWRKMIIRNVIIVTIIAIVISLLLPLQYTSTATILPPNAEQNLMAGLLASGLSTGGTGISNLGATMMGLTTPSDLYAAILKSGNIKSRLVEKYNLKKIFKTKTYHDTYKMLDEVTKIKVSPEGLISVSVTYKDKYLATDLANSYIEELDRFNTETAMTTGKKYRIFVEQRLKDTQDSLTKAEESLRKFQEQHRTVALDIEIQNAIATIAKLKSEIILREVQKGAVASASGFSNPYVTNIEQELRELKRQLAKIEFGTMDTTRKEFGAGFSIPFARLPELSLEYARLLRDVKIQEAVFELLTQQYEQAKIMESKDTPTVQILDRASPPEKRSSPKRTRIVILSALFAFLFCLLYITAAEYLNNLKQNAIVYAKWQKVIKEFKLDFHYYRQKILKKKNR